MNSLPQQGLVRMETIAGRSGAKAIHEDGESASCPAYSGAVRG